MRFKNLLMQLFVISPLTTVMGVCTILFFFPFLPIGESIWEDLNGGAGIVMLVILFSIPVTISKILLKIKGKAVETTYWDENFEYELRHDYGNQYSWHQTKGGWTTNTKFGVFIYALFSPILMLTRVAAIFFAFVSLNKKSRFFSWYGPFNYKAAGMKAIPLQKILHFLFDVMIVF